MNFYRGKFRPKFPGKYDGDYTGIVYRSLWERQVFRFLDENPGVISWSSEETVIPYRCATDGRVHRYFIDLKVKFKTGITYLIEIKPESQTIQPTKKRMSKKYLAEVMTWAKNDSKWKAAKRYADDRGYVFEIWTERFIQESLGIKLLTSKKIKKKL